MDHRASEAGNALIYVLIAIALFGALSFTLGRQTDTSEANAVTDERVELYASQLISYSAQAKSAVDQMLFTAATQINDLDFTAPTDAGFDTGTVIHRVYHPQGGGLTPGRLSEDITNQVTADPAPGWYMGRFNNVEWTASTADDVILVAYQISQAACEKINQKVTGTTAIPSITAEIRNVLIDAADHTGANVELTTDLGDICPDCENRASLCVENGGIYGYYTIIADQ